MPSPLPIIRDSLKGAFLVILAFLLLDGIAGQGIVIAQHGKHLLTGCALLLPVAATLAIAGRLIFRSKDETSLTRVALAIVCLSLVLRLIWIFTVSSYQVNDFGRYLNLATDKGDTIYYRRAAFYTYPLVLLLGKSLAALKITNVLLATVTTWIFFLAGRIVVGSRVAALSLLFFMWHPDLWYSITLASHDIPGLFWLALFFYFSAFLQRRLWAGGKLRASNLLISVLLGVCIFFVGAVRSYHYGAIIALTACAAVHSVLIFVPRISKHSSQVELTGTLRGAPALWRLKYAALHVGLLLVVPVAVYGAAQMQVWKALHFDSRGLGSGLVCYVTAADVLGASQYEEIANWNEEQCPMIKGDERLGFALRKLMHEITHSPAEYFLHIERKNRVLSMADAYLGWSTFTSYETWDTTHDQVKRTNTFNFEAQQVAIALIHAVLLLFVLWRTLLCAGRPMRLAALVPVSFSVTYYAMFLFVLETQSRYNIFLIFIFSWMAAEAVLDLYQRNLGTCSAPLALSALKRFYLGGVAILTLAAGVYLFASSLIAESWLTLRDQTGFTRTPPADLVKQAKGFPEVPPLFLVNNFKQLVLAYPVEGDIPPGGVIAAQRTFVVLERPRHHLRFFLSTTAVRSGPFEDKISWEDADIEYLIGVNSRLIASGKLNDFNGNKYFSFDSATSPFFGPRMTLQLVLRNLHDVLRVAPERGPVVSLEYIDLQ